MDELKKALQEMAKKLELDESVVTEVSTLVESAIATAKADAVQEKEAELQESVKQQLEEGRKAYEVELVEQAKAAAAEFAEEQRSRLVETKEYERMRDFVEDLHEAFSGFGMAGESLEENFRLKDEVEQLQEEVQKLETKLEESKCSQYLTTSLNESQLSELQKDKLVRVLSYTSPKSLNEFKAVVDNLITEAVNSSKTTDDAGENQLNENVEPENKQPAGTAIDWLNVMVKK